MKRKEYLSEKRKIRTVVSLKLLVLQHAK